jgi:hypothetical protein
VIIEQVSAAGAHNAPFRVNLIGKRFSLNRSNEDSECGDRKMGKNGCIRA